MPEQAPLSRHAFHNWRLDQAHRRLPSWETEWIVSRKCRGFCESVPTALYILRPFVARPRCHRGGGNIRANGRAKHFRLRRPLAAKIASRVASESRRLGSSRTSALRVLVQVFEVLDAIIRLGDMCCSVKIKRWIGFSRHWLRSNSAANQSSNSGLGWSAALRHRSHWAC